MILLVTHNLSLITAPSNSTSLRRPAPVVRDRRRIANRNHANARVVDCANRRLAATARTFHAHLGLLHARFHRLLSCFVRRLLSGERSALARTAKAARAG